ncbi:hypothetical protein [Syntrophomonas palmitatica]|uniref:hypothetical protein n=1 Tax=Syntrophomonas palmitatica TaxID=402877 RepID=UPI0012EDDE88|nr:hypothetical protein [Syntrophomonas palmitatica]
MSSPRPLLFAGVCRGADPSGLRVHRSTDLRECQAKVKNLETHTSPAFGVVFAAD